MSKDILAETEIVSSLLARNQANAKSADNKIIN